MNNNGGNYIKISENRDHTIDALRGLGIILVMLGHLNPDEYILKYIYSFHMFLFFFISGFLAHRRTDTFWHYTVIRFNRLLIPFFFWNCASLCIDAVWLHNSDCSNYFMQLFFLRGGGKLELSCLVPCGFVLARYRFVWFDENRQGSALDNDMPLQRNMGCDIFKGEGSSFRITYFANSNCICAFRPGV